MTIAKPSRVKRHRLIGAVASLAMAGGVVAACGSSASSASASSPINVGVIAGFTGTTSYIGKTFLSGATTAADIINANGGVMGRHIKLIPVDDGFDPVDAVTDVRQMLATDHVSGVLGLAEPDYPNALPILNQQHMVSFTHIGSPSLDNKLMPYSFRSQPSDAVVGTAMSYYASVKHYQNIAIALDASQGAQTLLPSMKAAAKKLGLNIVANVTLPVTAGSYVPEVQQLISSHPDAILMQATTTDEAGNFFSDLRQQGGGNIPIVASDLSAAADWVKAAGVSYDEKQIVSIVPSAAGGPGQSTFLTEFHKLYKTGPQNAAPNMYDSLNVMALAMDAAGSTKPTTYVKDIPKVTTPGSGVTTVYTYAQGYKLLKEHKSIKYSGVASPMTYTKYHTVSGGFAAVRTAASGSETVLTKLPASKLTSLLPQ